MYDPEDVGLMLWKWMRPSGDFQHLPSWRELVVATALSLRRHHADTLIVPMSLIRDAYRAEILGGLDAAGEEVLHVFLEADAGVLRDRLNARVTHPDKDWDQAARELGMTGADEMVVAAARAAGRDAHAALGQAHPRRTGRQSAGQVTGADFGRPRCPISVDLAHMSIGDLGCASLTETARPSLSQDHGTDRRQRCRLW